MTQPMHTIGHDMSSGQKWTLLIIDDDEPTREVLAQSIESLGDFRVYQAANGLDGLAQFQKIGNVDGVLVDINMPGMNGIEFISRIKELDNSVVAIVITGFPSMDVIIEAMRAGATDFLCKPFKFDQLRFAMERLARERRILLNNQLLSQEVLAKKALEELNQKLEKKIKEQTVLFTISDTLSRIKNTQELYQQLVTLAATLTETSDAKFWVVNYDTRTLMLTAALNSFHECEREISLDRKDLPPVQVVCDGIPILVDGSCGPGHHLLVPIFIRNEVFGVLAVSSPIRDQSFEEGIFLLHLLAEKASLTIENLLLYESVIQNLHATLKALVRSLEAKDPYTKEHSHRVTQVAVSIATIMECNPEELDSLRFAGPLHDIGKIGISDQILMKPGKLTKDEYEIIKSHPVIGAEIVGHLGLLPVEKAIIRHHHERWDGKGYPDGLKQEEIPLLSRILAVADTFDAMTSCRPYRKALSIQEAEQEIKRNAGSQFDPVVVEAFDKYLAISDHQ